MRSRRAIAGRVPAAVPGEDPVRRAVRAFVVAILLLRWSVPTEGSPLGNTLWIAQFSLLVGAVWGWSLVRAGSPRLRVDRFDAALAVLVGAQVLSAVAVVVRGDGDGRAAVNVAWEWAAVLVTFVVARNVFDTRRRASSLVAFVVVATVVSAGLGVWQHFVGFPRLAAEYVTERDELDRLTLLPVRSPAEERRLAELRTSFASQGVPIAGPGREAFENRLLGSREPLGRFALANTFAGWLLVGAFALVGLLLQGGRGRAVTLVLAIGLALVLYGLLLTKSRTAWVGLAVGAAGWAWTRWTAGDRSVPRWAWGAIAGAGLLVAGGVAIGAFTGGLDREVLAQAPRSLRFRLQYWTGTVGVVADNPLLGTGPGNFRQHYVAHMPPEASEEIADPHNLVLDVWANAGPLALLGLLAAVWFGSHSYREETGPNVGKDAATDPPDDVRDAPGNDVVAGVGIGAALLCVKAFVAAEDPIEPLLLGASTFALTLAAVRFRAADDRPSGLGWGAVAVLVHLLGAGGIAMPAVQLVLLVTIVVAFADGDGRPVSRRTASMIGLVVGLLFAGQLVTATLPVVEASQRIEAAHAAATEGQPARARELFESAVARDGLAPEPAEAAAGFAFEQWRSSAGHDGAAFRRAVRLQEESIRRDSRSAIRRAVLADLLAEHYRSTGDRPNGERAASLLAESVALYPTNVELRARRSFLLEELGQHDAARTEATTAVRLDDVNRAEGHLDRVLPDDDRARLRSIAGRVEPDPGPR